MSDTTAPPETATCQATYEQVEPRDRARTHTCDLRAGHSLLHHCPRCGNNWERPERAWSA